MLAATHGPWDQFPSPRFPRSSVLFKGLVECPQVQDKTGALGLGRNPSVVTANLMVLGCMNLCLSLASETGLGLIGGWCLLDHYQHSRS